METVAIYSEHPVRVYGITVKRGLALLQVWGRQTDIPSANRALNQLRLQLRPLFMMAAWPRGEPQISICLSLDSAAKADSVMAATGFEAAMPVPVCAIHLQGPHFGDRWGILNYALDGLSQAHVNPLAINASMHSILLAIKPEDEDAAVAGLRLNFREPERA